MAREKKYKQKETEFAHKIREEFPSAPAEVKYSIAARACEVGSGRVGRKKYATIRSVPQLWLTSDITKMVTTICAPIYK